MNTQISSPTTNNNCLSPFNIKRKCLSSLTNHNSSPSYSLSTVNLVANNSSPVHLNDSFDENISCKRYMSSSRRHHQQNQQHSSRRSSGTLFARYKSAPLTTTFNNQLDDISNKKLDMSPSFKSQMQQQIQQPLNDISNLLQSKHKISQSDDQIMDDVNDLENLIYGNSENTQQQQLIKQSLDIEASCHGLIGDRSKKHILPTIISNKHQDLHCISPHTLVDVLDGKFNDQIDECIVVDSRYPYEYDAGHIRFAKNIFTIQKLYEEFFIKRHLDDSNIQKEADLSTTKYKRVIVVFHCEFSSERGPKLLKFLRNQDRCINEPVYPNLFYPELYLLEGGYKSFYLNFKNYCEPQDYKPMLHAEHLNELRHFRAKAKSWSNEATRHKTIFKFNNSVSSSCDNNTSDNSSDNIESPMSESHKIVKMKTFY